MTSTNKGTCQICGTIQKLRKGKMVKHNHNITWNGSDGYTKDCVGVGQLPLEQDCEGLKSYIQHTEKGLELRRDSIRTDTIEKTEQYIKYLQARVDACKPV